MFAIIIKYDRMLVYKYVRWDLICIFVLPKRKKHFLQ